MSNRTKKIIMSVIVPLILMALVYGLWTVMKASVTQGQKELTIEVIHGDETSKTFTVETDAEFLRAALEDNGIVEGEESDFGLYILSADGETADAAEQEWWCITRGGEMVSTGVDTTPIADGEKYEVSLVTGW